MGLRLGVYQFQEIAHFTGFGSKGFPDSGVSTTKKKTNEQRYQKIMENDNTYLHDSPRDLLGDTRSVPRRRGNTSSSS